MYCNCVVSSEGTFPPDFRELQDFGFVHRRHSDTNMLMHRQPYVVSELHIKRATYPCILYNSNQAPLETRSSTGDTPLTLATHFGHAHAVEKLLAMGANPLAMDDDGHAAGKLMQHCFSSLGRALVCKYRALAYQVYRGGIRASGHEAGLEEKT